MNKQVSRGIFLLLGPLCPLTSWGMDDIDRFNGMQLAWVRVSPAGVEEKQAAPAKPKPKPKPAVSAPAPAPQPKPAPPAVAPAPAVRSVVPAPVAKPVPAPAATPAAQPAPVVKPPGQVPPVARHREARRQAASFEWLLGLGLEVGGDELGVVTYSDGSSASVKANTGLAFSAGGLIPNDDDGTFATQITVGYKSGGPKLWSNEVNWSAIPIEALEFYRAGGVRLGLGVSYQLNPKLRVNVPGASFTTQFNNAVGLVAQIGWRPAKADYSVDLRYMRINFQASDVPNAPLVNGNVGGLYLNFYY